MVELTIIKTPCIGVCSTGIGDNVCRGCKRFSHEVIDWNSYSAEQKKIIADRLESFLAKIVSNFIVIFDQDKLFAQIKHQQIQFQPQQNPYCWVFNLLRAGASQIQSLEVYGLSYQIGWGGTPLAVIRDHIDKDFYALSCAYYDRYISPNY
jgi:predicted Fe-S protein YdhL (DUF1289 family)